MSLHRGAMVAMNASDKPLNVGCRPFGESFFRSGEAAFAAIVNTQVLTTEPSDVTYRAGAFALSADSVTVE
jgi:hypothetical protein